MFWYQSGTLHTVRVYDYGAIILANACYVKGNMLANAIFGRRQCDMTICERMFMLIDNTPGKTASGLCKRLGLKTNATTTWKTRGTDPPAKYLVCICEYLGVPVEQLLTGEIKQSDGSFTLDEREKNLIEHFRALDLDGKASVEHKAVEEHRRVRLEGDSEATAN